MKLIKSKFCSSCQGVNRALSIYQNELKKSNNIFLTNLICHNKEVNERYNIQVFDEKKEPPFTLVISAHGITKEKKIFYENKKDIKLVSAICPVVEKNLNRIDELTNLNDTMIIYVGKKNHIEAQSAASFLRKSDFFIESEFEIDNILNNIDYSKNIRMEVIVQTTFSQNVLEKIFEKLKSNDIEFNIFNDICPDCSLRRQDIVKNACHCDTVLVIGDGKSSNANELVNVAKRLDKDVFLVMNVSEAVKLCNSNKINKNQKLYIISSASSTSEIFDEIYNFFLKRFNNG